MDAATPAPALAANDTTPKPTLVTVSVYGARRTNVPASSVLGAASPQGDVTGPYTIGDGAATGDGAEASRQQPMFEDAVRRGWLIEPPFNYRRLSQIFNESDILLSVTGAMETNIAAFGVSLVPFDAEAHRSAEGDASSPPEAPPPAGDDAEPGAGAEPGPLGKGRARARAAKSPARQEIEAEKKRLSLWLENAGELESLVSIARRTRIDQEVFGDGYWELRRDAKGRLAAISHVPAYYVRKGPLDTKRTVVRIKIRDEQGRWRTRVSYQRFRKMAQWVNGRIVWFKEHGDPRKLNFETGEYDESTPPELCATEMLCFSAYVPDSIYGRPRWRGNANDVTGRANASALNNDTLDNRGIPPYLLLVSGGQLVGDQGRSVTETIREHFLACKQPENWNVPLVLNAQSSSYNSAAGDGPAAPVRIEVEDLTKALQNDAHFVTYRESVVKDVAMAYRLPDIYLGRGANYNRATAMAAKEVAEEQVFAPERAMFDDIMNRRLLPELGAVHWKFKSNGPPLLDEERLTRLLEMGMKGFALTPAQIASVIEPLLGIRLETTADWAKIPTAALDGLVKKGALPEGLATLVGVIVNALSHDGHDAGGGGQGGVTPGFEDPNVPTDATPTGDGPAADTPTDTAPDADTPAAP